VTPRAAGLIAGGVGLLAAGWFKGWPELTALGAAAIALVVLALIAVGPLPRVQVALDKAAIKVVRGQAATVRMTLHAPRHRRWLRIVEGSPSDPVATSPIARPDPGGAVSLRLPVDTSVRGERPIGPYAVVHGDPWSIVRRVAGRSEGGVLTVQPRTVEIVVKQHVSGAPNHTVIVLDTDASAYGSDDQFGSGWVAERFEAAVEVAASYAVANADRSEQLYVVTTTRGGPVTTGAGGAKDAFLDAFAAVSAVSPVETAPEEIAPLVRRTHCRLLMLITGTPGPRVLAAMRALAPITSSLTVVRVASQRREPLQSLRVLDVERAEDLVGAP
jgi:uncharacterized protein (DUF58 family)